MSEPIEPAMLGTEMEAPPRRHGRMRLIEPFLASVPTLIGVIVGAVASHFAEVQRVDFEREDRFRHEQIERVASVAHGFDSLAQPLSAMIATLQTRQQALCRFMPLASATETKLRDTGALRGRLFSPGPVDPNYTADYGRQLDALAAGSDPAAKAGAGLLKSMISLYVPMLAEVETADVQFARKREDFQATLMFEVKVYFPERIRKEVSATVDAYHQIGKQAASVQAPNQLCAVDPQALRARLIALNNSSARDMTAFAQTLEPELGDKSIQD